ncbi:MAG: Txe/YoeB family addiction module toxin [Truepera sp.]|nr:Txe/YoeB family addiction module toxin [Truepera sp.]
MSREDPAAIAFSRQAWADYQYWIQHDRTVARRIARLIEECLQDPFQGVGKPEPLKHELADCWSRRITKEHRLVYRVTEGRCIAVQCRYHY